MSCVRSIFYPITHYRREMAPIPVFIAFDSNRRDVVGFMSTISSPIQLPPPREKFAPTVSGDWPPTWYSRSWFLTRFAPPLFCAGEGGFLSSRFLAQPGSWALRLFSQSWHPSFDPPSSLHSFSPGAQEVKEVFHTRHSVISTLVLAELAARHCPGYQVGSPPWPRPQTWCRGVHPRLPSQRASTLIKPKTNLNNWDW